MRTLGLIFSVLAIPLIALLLFTGRYDAAPVTRTFLDRNGKIIGSLNPAYQGVQYWTSLDRIPSAVIRDTVDSEDRWFFWHPGVNPASLAQAAVDNLRNGRVVRGGSTITQQLAKNLIQEREYRGTPISRTWFNKFRETLLALGLETKHSKQWILERYLNTAYYGRRSYGVAAAAKTYFGKELAELSSDEIDFLVTRPKAPNRTSPPPPSLIRRGLGEVARHFLEYVAANTPNSGPILQTTLDLDLQRRLEEATDRLLASRASQDPKLTGAVTVIDVKTGALLAMVGSRDYFDDAIAGQVNAAVALRQPGSTLKPFTYFAAFSKGFGPNSIVSDEPTSFQAAGVEESEAYAPQNFDRRYHGDMTIREALANSYNVPAVVTLNEIGLSAYHDLLRRFGFTTLTRPPLHYGLAVTLGSGEVTLLELTNAYAALARGGSFKPYRFTPAARGPAKSAVEILPDAARYAAQVTGILSDPTARLKAFGFNESMEIEGHEVAVKTGTSYEHRDNWTAGYTPSYAVGVWVGHADGSPMIGPNGTMPTTGASGAAPLWHAAMESVLRDQPAESFGLPLETPRRNIPYREARTDGPPARALRILSPLANATFRVHSYLPSEHQKIAAQAAAASGDTLRWYLDGRFLASSQAKEHVWILPETGKHTLRVEDEKGLNEEIAFRVVNEQND